MSTAHSCYFRHKVWLSTTCRPQQLPAHFVASLYLMEELKQQVSSWGFQGSQQEMDSLLAVLVSNGMSFLQDLVGINSCNELEGGEHLPHACISFVNTIMSQQRIAPKRASDQSSVVAMAMSAASSSRETDTSGAGPRAALKRLNLTESNRSDWVKRARSAALDRQHSAITQ